LRDLKSRDQRFTGMASLETTVARLASALNDFHNPDVGANATSVVERSPETGQSRPVTCSREGGS